MVADALQRFHPLIHRWFSDEVGAPTDIQHSAWAAIAEGRHCLITAPTGSGKTLAAFLWAIDRLVTGVWPADGVRVVYLSPLKALNNDIQRNLLTPLDALKRVFAEAGAAFPEIRVLTRSGDTPPSERQAMVRRPPEILVTTPESLNLLLSSPRARAMLNGVRTIILDEIHAVAGTKRGTHLITAVDRLVPLAGEFQRIALSATVRPMEAIAAFVGGYTRTESGDDTEYHPRPVAILRSPSAKTYDTRVCFPHETLYEPGGGTRWPALAKALKEVVARNRSTLIFAVSRRLCERLTLYMNEDEDHLVAYAHHGSLALEMRRLVEQKLKDGALSAIVATNSLELGIDIGALDEVILVQAPLSIAAAVQRIGRAGHQVGAVSRGLLYPIHAHDLLETAAMARAIRAQDIEEIRPVPAPLDVLAQVLVSMTGVETWNVDTLYDFIRTSAPYRHLPRTSFDRVVQMLVGRYASSRIRALQPVVSLDAVDNTLRGKPAGLQILYRSGGTIADRGYFNLRRQDSKAKIGELDEEFVWERFLGDTFIFGTQAWTIRQITHNDVLVLPGDPNRAMAPFWKGDGIPRSDHFSRRISEFLENAEQRLEDPAWREWLMHEVPMEERAADALIAYLRQQRAATKTPLPHRHHLLAEHCVDYRRGEEHPQLILHTLWGAPVNRPLTFALAQALADRDGNHPEVFCDNDAIVVPLTEMNTTPDPFRLVTPENLEALLRKKLEQTGFFGARFRENASRALLLPRDAFGKRMPLWMTRVRSKRLLEAIAEYPDFPILAETWRTCLQDEFALDRLKALLNEIRAGTIAVSRAETSTPSPFTKSLMWQQTNSYMYRDDAPEVPVRSQLRDDVLSEVTHTADLRPQIDPDLAAVFVRKLQRTQPGYAPTTPDDLLDWVKERQFLPWAEWEALLCAVERDTGAPGAVLVDAIAEKLIYISGSTSSIRGVSALEFAARLRLIFHADENTIALSSLPKNRPLDPAALAREEDSEDTLSLADWLAEWLRFYGPLPESVLKTLLPVPAETLLHALEELVEAETLIAGHLTRGHEALEFCDTENFESLLRIARAAARPTLAPLPAAKLPLFLAAWQGITPAEGKPSANDRALESLLGFPASVDLLESDYLAARISDYRPGVLDEWLENAALLWVGCGDRRIFLAPRDALPLFCDHALDDSVIAESGNLLPGPVGRYTLSELLDHTHLTTSELTQRLWKAAWNGSVTCDSYAPVRIGLRSRFRTRPAEAPAQRSRRGAFRAWKASRSFEGCWLAVPRPSLPEDALEAAELDNERARLLLERYGVVFRELIERELPALQWAAVFRALRRIELAGEAVAGSFFEGIHGVQFAAPGAIQRLYAPLPETALFWINATDPISVCGLGVEGLQAELPARLKTTRLIYHGSQVVLVVRKSGKELEFRISPDDPQLMQCLQVLRTLPMTGSSGKSGITVELINSAPATKSEYLPALREHFTAVADPRRITLYTKDTFRH